MNTPTQRLQLLTFEEFNDAARRDPYYRGRWPYYEAVLRQIEKFGPLESVLEVGPHTLRLVRGSDTMDQRPGLADLTYLHDASVVPWPVPDGRYDLVLALQVWEHLDGRQREAFAEVRRVARAAILSFPYRWFCPDDPSHHDVSEATIEWWTLGVPASSVVIVPGARKRIIYTFRFDRA